MSSPSPIKARDVAFFVAIANVHYPILELLRTEISYGLIPVQLLLLAGMALVTDRSGVIMRGSAYAVVATMFFAALFVLGVGFVPLGAFVVITQTATAIVFIDYLLSLGPEGARSSLYNVQRLLGIYVVGFALLVIALRIHNDRALFTQVAESNYMGLLTTYLVLNLLRRSRVTPPARRLTFASVMVNLLGEQRASLLLNAVVIVRRALASNRAIILVTVGGAASLTILFAGNFILRAAQPLLASVLAYVALIPLGFQNLETIIRYAVATPDSGLDASLMLRAISMVYIGQQILRDPLRPVATGENEYLGVSHNLPLEYFKVGGLLFFVLSAGVVLARYRKLFTRGYFTIDAFGALLCLLYSQLFNDLFLGFLLLPLAIYPGRRLAARTSSVSPASNAMVAASSARLD